MDVLYAFEPEHTPGWHIADVAEELSAPFGRPVDLTPGEYLPPRFAARVLPTARIIYGSAGTQAS